MGLQDKVKEHDPNREENQEETLDTETIDEWIFGIDSSESGGTMSMIYGEDGTGKSGVALSSVKEVDGKVLLLDLDNSASSLLKYYDEEEKKRIIIRNPQVQKYDEEEDEYVIDYDTTFERIKGAIQRVNEKHEEENIDVLVIDGLGTLTTFAERQMRIVKNADPEDGIEIRFWKRRNQIINDILEQAKSLPIHTLFVGHNDFIMKNKADNEVSSLVEDINKKQHNKIHTTRHKIGDITKFKAEFDKSKYDVANEGKEFTFLEVEHSDENEEGAEVDWDSKELVREILDLSNGGDE